MIVTTTDTVQHTNTTPYFFMGDAARFIAPDALLIGDEIERARHCPPCEFAAR